MVTTEPVSPKKGSRPQQKKEDSAPLTPAPEKRNGGGGGGRTKAKAGKPALQKKESRETTKSDGKPDAKGPTKMKHWNKTSKKKPIANTKDASTAVSVGKEVIDRKGG